MGVLSTCKSVYYTYVRWPEEGVRSPGTGVTGPSCESPCGVET